MRARIRDAGDFRLREFLREIERERAPAAAELEDVLAVDDAGALKPVAESSGLMGDMKTKDFGPIPAKAPNYPTSWLPTERVAKAWRAMLTEQPIEP